MTEKEEQMLQWVDEIREETYQAIKHQSAALRKIAALAVLIVAKPVENEMARPEYETPEQPKLDKVALDIINEPIADEVPMDHHERNVRAYMHDFNVSRETTEKELTVEPEPKIPKGKRVALNDYDTPLDLKAAGTSRDDRILYYRKCGKTLAWIANQVGCAPQTVANVINRRKAKEEAKLKSEASFARYGGGR